MEKTIITIIASFLVVISVVVAIEIWGRVQIEQARAEAVKEAVKNNGVVIIWGK